MAAASVLSDELYVRRPAASALSSGFPLLLHAHFTVESVTLGMCWNVSGIVRNEEERLILSPVAPVGPALQRRRKLAACKTLACKGTNTPCGRLTTVQFANGPKRSVGHVLGGEKGNFLIRGRGRPPVNGGRTIGILSIRGPEISLGSLRVAPIHG